MSGSKTELSQVEKNIFSSIEKNDTVLLRTLLVDKPSVNIIDENGMTPLQHAAYKGNREMVQMLLDHGAEANLCKHQHNYTALHFGGLSGNVDVCLALLMAGAKTNVTNTVNRTAAQMAAFVGHHSCVAIINNYIPKADVDFFSKLQGTQTQPLLPPFLSESFHKFLMQINVHPVKVALNISNFVGLSDHLSEIKTILVQMSEKEMKRGAENNEVMAFKFHYLSCIVSEILNIQAKNATDTKPIDFVEVFSKKILKPNNDGTLQILDGFLRDYIKTFPFRECTLFRQMVSSLAGKDPPSALSVVSSAINGQRGFIDNISTCNTCGEEKPAKKCSKCKVAQYCDRNCQKLHWHWHKKMCAKLLELSELQSKDEITAAPAPDSAELSAELQNLLVQN